MFSYVTFVKEFAPLVHRSSFLVLMGIICSRGFEDKIYISETPSNIKRSLEKVK